MMRPLFKVLLTMVALTAVVSSCSDDDDFVYPELYTEFADLHTDAQGTVDRIVNDKGESWTIGPVKGLMELTADTTYRAVVRYEPQNTSSGGEAKLYSSQGVIAPVPVMASHLNPFLTNPVKIQSIWRGGDYVNIVLNVLSKDKNHKYHFAISSFERVENGDGNLLVISLYHDDNDDMQAFNRTVYLSLPLWSLGDMLKKGDSIAVDINTYQDGVVRTVFEY